MSIKRIRIDYNSKHAPGLFVIRCKADGRIEGENSALEARQQRHGANTVKRAVKNGKKH